MSPDFNNYLSPFTWRYGSPEMRHIWSEIYKRKLWRKIWISLAEVQSELGLIDPGKITAIKEHQNDVDIQRSLEIEDDIHHDLMAELRAFAEQAPEGGGILHLGATSTDIEDNAEALRIRESLGIILIKLRELLLVFAQKIDTWANVPVMAFTHIQPAEPTTLGYRLAAYAQDLMMDWLNLSQLRTDVKGKGFKGAVGTSAAYVELLGVEQLPVFEKRLSERLDLPFFEITNQVYPRKQDFQVMSALSGLGASLYKLAFDLRILQSSPFGEWSEPFGANQVGSSAMPFKRNPINAEKINSLGRALAQMPRLAWDNAAHSLLERTLDDSANRRSMLPEAFLISDELLRVTKRVVIGLQIYPDGLARNLELYGPFAAIERVLMALAKSGADRQVMHERLRQHSMHAWSAIQHGESNPLKALIIQDAIIRDYLGEQEIETLMDATDHLGDAPQRASAMADRIRVLMTSTPVESQL